MSYVARTGGIDPHSSRHVGSRHSRFASECGGEKSPSAVERYVVVAVDVDDAVAVVAVVVVVVVAAAAVALHCFDC